VVTGGRWRGAGVPSFSRGDSAILRSCVARNDGEIFFSRNKHKPLINTVKLSRPKLGMLPPLVLGGIIENQNSLFVKP
jgi:hypothetical protein